jgi:hypothetical protein
MPFKGTLTGCLKIFAVSVSLGGLYALYQLLEMSRQVLTPEDLRWLLIVTVFGLAGSLLLIFGALAILLSDRLLEVVHKFQDLRTKKAHEHKSAIVSERIGHLELVLTSALEGVDRRLRILEEKFSEEPLSLTEGDSRELDFLGISEGSSFRIRSYNELSSNRRMLLG